MIFFPLDELNDRCKGAALTFVKKYEAICVQLSSVISKKSQSVYVAFENDIAEKEIWGVLSLSKTVLHCLPHAGLPQSAAAPHIENRATSRELSFVRDLADFYRTEKLPLPSCVNGQERGSELILQALDLLSLKPGVVNRYDLLRLDVKSYLHLEPPLLPPNHGLVRCKSDLPEPLLQSLIHLQKQYEIEEVLPPCYSFNEDASRLKLKASLRKQYVLALDDGNGNLVSKAQTNAIGLKCAQIGGVYTLPEKRHNSFSYITVFTLCKKILNAKKLPVLYVKKENEAAKNLYKKLKFIKLGDYTIAYFSI